MSKLATSGVSSAARSTALYRLYDADDQILYVGASSLELRWKDHAKSRLWWSEVTRQELT